jgi:hypothetical protein
MTDFDPKEQRLRRTLQAVAERVPVAPDDEAHWSRFPIPTSHRRRRLLTGVVTAVIIVIGFGVALAYGPRSSDGGGTLKGNSVAPTASSVRWSPTRSVAPNFALTLVACTSESFCLGLGANDKTGAAGTTVWTGSTWTKPRTLGAPSTGVVRSLSCASPGFCEALSTGAAYTWNGEHWSSAMLLAGALASTTTIEVTSVSCPSSSFCMAVDNAGDDFLFDGHRWSAPVHFDSTPSNGDTSGPSSVSCSSPTSCMVVDADGFALQWRGNSWVPPVDATPPPLDAVSCPSRNWCLAMNSDSYASTWNGRTWTGPRFVDPDSMAISQRPSTTPVSWGEGDFGLLSVSCASRTFCVAIDDAGYAVSFDGTSWSSPISIGPGLDNRDMIACSAPRFCVVTSNEGRVIIGRG